jgi:peptidyl-prolyl cis-trans isomerase-like 2
MANAGPNSNQSQFFITFRSCKHLDGKHAIFGKLVGGLETLTEIERIEVDNKDAPIEDIVIISTQIFVDPYQEADEQLAAERQVEVEKIQKEKEEIAKKKLSAKKLPLKAVREGVGKYLMKLPTKSKASATATSSDEPAAKKKKASNNFNNFNSW